MQSLPPPNSNEICPQKRENSRFLPAFNACLLENYLILIILSFSLLFVVFPFTLFHVKRERQSSHHVFATETEEITQPLTISRSFRWLQLENELNLMIIHDDSLTFSGVGLEIAVGSAFDPDHMPGLAHLLEHMVFLGSKKHPNASFFRDFVGLNGGKTNALTSDESSRYYFSVNTENLAQAVDIFASLFEDPLLNPSRVDQEVLAVNNEFHMNLQKNSWRLFELLRRHARENHTFHRFSAGNLQTLKLSPEKMGIKLHEELRNFFEKYYSSHKINVVVIGSQKLDFLQAIAEKSFSRLKNKRKSYVLPQNLEISKKTPAFPTESLGKLVWYKALGNQNTISVVFPLESPKKPADFLANAVDFVDFLVNFRGVGGLFSELSRKQLIYSLETAKIQKTSDFLAYVVTFSVDEIAQTKQIVAHLFDFLRRLREIALSESLYGRFSLISHVNFLFSKRKPLESEILGLVSKLKGLVSGEMPLKDLLLHRETLRKYEAETIGKVLRKLDIANALVFVGSNELEAEDFLVRKQGNRSEIKGDSQEKKGITAIFKEKDEFLEDFVQEIAGNGGKLTRFALKPRVSFKETPKTQQKTEDFAQFLQETGTLCEYFEELGDFPLKSREFFRFSAEKPQISCHSSSENASFQTEKLNSFEETMKIYYKSQQINENFFESRDFSKENSTFANFSFEISPRFFPEIANFSHSSTDFLPKVEETAYFSRLRRDFSENLPQTPRESWENQRFPDKLSANHTETALWHRFLRDFRANARVFLRFSRENVRKSGVLKVFVESFAQKLEETYFEAFLLGYKAEISWKDEGLELEIEAFPDKFAEFFKEIAGKFVRFPHELSEKEFEFQRRRLENEEENAKISQALPQITEILREILQKTAKSRENSVKNTSFQDFREVFAQLLRNPEKTVFFAGNIEKNQSFSLFEAFQSEISQQNQGSSLEIPAKPLENQGKSEDFARNSSIFRVSEEFSAVIAWKNANELDENQGIVNYYEIGARNDDNLAKSLTISQLLGLKAFDFLRTREQLGYIVYCRLFSLGEIDAFTVNVQGIAHNPEEMDRKIELFLREFEVFLENFQENELSRVLSEVSRRFRGGNAEFGANVEEMWREIVENEDLKRKQRVFKRINELRKEELVQFFKETFKFHCKKLSLRLFSRRNQENSTALGNSSENYCGKPEKLVKREDFFEE